MHGHQDRKTCKREGLSGGIKLHHQLTMELCASRETIKKDGQEGGETESEVSSLKRTDGERPESGKETRQTSQKEGKCINRRRVIKTGKNTRQVEHDWSVRGLKSSAWGKKNMRGRPKQEIGGKKNVLYFSLMQRNGAGPI